MGLTVVFFGTPEFAVPSLEALIRSPDFEVTGVITAPDRPRGRGLKVTPPPVKVVAARANIPVLQPPSLRDPEVLSWIRDRHPDFIVVAAYGRLIPPAILEIPKYAPVNIHASLLPEYRGASPVTHAILDGRQETGITYMIMTEALDAGPILKQIREPIHPDDTTGTLESRLAHIGARHLPDTLVAYARGEIKPQPQDDSRATYAPRLKKTDGHMDWSKPAAYLERFIRAMDPWPVAYTGFRNMTLKIWRARVVPCPPGPESPPGTTVAITRDQWVASTGDGCLELLEVQPPGKKRMKASAFINGYRVRSGEPMNQSLINP